MGVLIFERSVDPFERSVGLLVGPVQVVVARKRVGGQLWLLVIQLINLGGGLCHLIGDYQLIKGVARQRVRVR